MDLIEGAVRAYDWGSSSAIPELLGRPASDQPVAELWLGAHPSDPARLGAAGRPLDEVIAADPVAMLGSGVVDRFGTLPFLLKVLAADEPLSLQVHPTVAQARVGFEREQAAGIPVDAPERFYRDRNHKPELICALTPFDALCGFREPGAALEVMATIATTALDPVRARIEAAPDGPGLRDALSWLLRLDPDRSGALVAAVAEACREAGPSRHPTERTTAVELASRYPHDAGVVIALLLNRVHLEPGDALYLGAGTLHSYLSGMGVEVMANSDNVLRGGLTSKPVDVDALLEIVETTPQRPAVQRPAVIDGVAEYESPAQEFSLRRFEIDGTSRIETAGPAVVLCVSGAVDAGTQTLDRGKAAWIPAADPPVSFTGRGTVFRAGVGDFALH